jgi:hypothetical protein
MTAVFTLLPSVSKQIDSLMPNADVADLERALTPYVKGTNLTTAPNEYEFYAMAMKIAQLVSKMSWVVANPQRADALIYHIITGIAKQSGWPSSAVMFQKPSYKPCYSSAFHFYTALNNCGVLNDSLPINPTARAIVAPAPVKVLPTPLSSVSVAQQKPTGRIISHIINRGKGSARITQREAAVAAAAAASVAATAAADAAIAAASSSTSTSTSTSSTSAVPSAAAAAPPERMEEPPFVPQSSTTLYPTLDPNVQQPTLDDVIQFGAASSSSATAPGSALDSMFDSNTTPSAVVPAKETRKHKSKKDKIGE